MLFHGEMANKNLDGRPEGRKKATLSRHDQSNMASAITFFYRVIQRVVNDEKN